MTAPAPPIGLPGFDLRGRLAVVTGASRGLGRAIATALAAAGADIVGVSASLEATGSAVQADVEGLGRSFEGHRVDFADRVAVAALADRLVDGRPVDILVNNAGTIERAPAVDHTDESWDRVIEVDLSSQFVLTREVGRQMVSRGSGKVIFTASMLSYQGGVNVVSYTAAKSAVAGITRALANEWAQHGVNVNAIAPGYFATDNTQALREDPQRSRAILERIPAGRWGAPEDLGGAAVFLASQASDYVHGTVLAVDGGVARPVTDIVEFHAAHRLVPVVVVDRVERALPLADALSAGGLPSAEVTLRTPAALPVIAAMAGRPGFVVGAGTVVRPEQVEQAVSAGAHYIVSPGYSAAVDRECRTLDVLHVPGVATATELQTALDAGREVVKFFPAAAAGGVAMVAALSAPFPSARFVPTGGIGAADLGDYLRLPSVLAVGGTWLAPRDVVEAGDLDAVSSATRAAVSQVAEQR